MLYFDTSFLVPLILPEASSDEIAAFVRALPAGQFTISHWTRVEFSSLIAREVRMGGLNARAGALADARFEAMVEDSFEVLLPNADDFGLAKRYLGMFETGLRAGDALHLAIGRNHRAGAIYTLDKALLKAGQMLDLPVSMGMRTAAFFTDRSGRGDRAAFRVLLSRDGGEPPQPGDEVPAIPDGR
jgi:predicted nucleic acid-binding protein